MGYFFMCEDFCDFFHSVFIWIKKFKNKGNIYAKNHSIFAILLLQICNVKSFLIQLVKKYIFFK